MPGTCPVFQALVFVLLVLSITGAGCTTPVAPPEGCTVHVTSEPAGGEVYLDNEYRGTTPVTITAVTAGTHAVDVRMSGYEPWSAPLTAPEGGNITIRALLLRIPATLPVTFATPATPAAVKSVPQIHVDGYWSYPQGRSGTVNPVPLVVHTEAFNVGDAGAREVTVSANLYYEGRMVCHDTVYLGTLAAGGHVSRESLVSCMLPSGISSPDLTVRFENLVVTT